MKPLDKRTLDIVSFFLHVIPEDYEEEEGEMCEGAREIMKLVMERIEELRKEEYEV